ncbi:hypothetical protein [Sedimentibacter sp. MB31-C6]|uniref:hypothetical protein n=1 Tax=Sedimentibacter sp. MB31-C6 TaxID=3109366 RepID=UPI002DDDB25E|nr:hypothetical protein [Sedimentibacter sp. MB36-C1]WSI05129.1 hypothetical protein U8307_04880 [Sedimentibacter sp. MB36-C1]
MNKIKKYLSNNRGTNILSYIIIVAVTVTIALEIIPYFNSTIESRSEKIISVFNSTDTVTSVD